MGSLDHFAAEKLASLSARSLRRDLVETTRGPSAQLIRDGRRLISFSCNDYLNLSTHPKIIAAAIAATRDYGAGAGGSRAVTGNHPLYTALESRLAALKNTDACVVFGSGYLANTGIIPALMSAGDVIFIDALAHACMWAGAKLAAARTIVFAHNDLAMLGNLLAAERHNYRNAMILTETVFSMDGDCTDLSQIATLAEQHDAWAMTDDAHGLGVIPRDKAAMCIALQMGTLSKAVGGYGGYLCASADVVAWVRNRARSFVYTTGLPPASIAAALAALDFIADNPEYCALPLAKAQRFTAALGIAPASSPIVPVIIGSAAAAIAASAQLQAEGFLVTAIRPPTVAAGTARLRFTFCAAHDDADIDRLAALVRDKILVRS
jgi:8-amino-7-oxononanoate synthase